MAVCNASMSIALQDSNISIISPLGLSNSWNSFTSESHIYQEVSSSPKTSIFDIVSHHARFYSSQ